MGANLPSDTKDINGVQYTVAMLPLKKWLQLKKVFLQTVGQAMAEAVASTDGGVADLMANISNKSIGQGIYVMCQHSNPDSDEAMLNLLSEATMIGDERLSPIGHWPRNMANLGPYLAFALGVQFEDFFGGLVSALTGAGQGLGK